MNESEIFPKKQIKPINWNNIEDSKDLEVWNKLTSNFWLPEAIPLSNDRKSWETMNDTEQEATMRVLANLTLLDTIQGSVGAVSLMPDATTQHEEAVYANIAFMEAFAAGTQLLSTKGWKNIEDVDASDKIAQYDPESNKVSFVFPTIVPSHFSEEVYELSGKDGVGRQIVSGGHRVYLEQREENSNDWKVVVKEARELVAGFDKENTRFRTAAPILSGEGLKDEEALLVAINARGKLAKKAILNSENDTIEVKFSFKKDHKVDKIVELSNAVGWEVKVLEPKGIYKKLSLQVPAHYLYDENESARIANKQYPVIAKNLSKHFAQWFKDVEEKSSTWYKDFVAELAYWNGYTTEEGNEVIVYSENIADIDFIVLASSLSGYHVDVKNSKQEDLVEGKNDCFIASIMCDKDTVKAEDFSVKRVDPQEVFCVQVPTTYLLTKNGSTPVVSGNCVHAKSYSNIFMTLASTPQIDEAFKWTQDNENVQKKAQIIERFYREDNPLKKKIASTLLESFLFYSGFYLPLNWAAHSKLTNTADTIRLILRDESIHGYYIGYKYQKGLENLSAREQSYYREHTYQLLEELFANEVQYTKDIYDPLGWTPDVNKFLKYNANKALHNLGYEELFVGEEARPSATILSSISSSTEENHDFFSGAGSSYVIGAAEETEEDDWDF